MTIAPGTRIGRYEIRSLLGAGGMGEVYLAHDGDLDRPVALKVLSPRLRDDPEGQALLAAEARSASALNHPNILTIYEIGRVDGPQGATTFIATEYVQGVTLRQRLARGPLPIQDATDVALQVASALEAAHGGGIVHGDVKPENIMLRPDGYVKLLDFGIARLMRPRADPTSKTAPLSAPGHDSGSSVVVGTTPYMSPEILREAAVDARSDIWSLGVVLYEMCRGQKPFVGASVNEIIVAILGTEPVPVCDPAERAPSPQVRRIVDGCLAKEADSRYQTAAQLRAELSRLKALVETGPEAAATLLAHTEPTTVLSKTAPVAPPELPAPLTPFVGREREVASAVALLQRSDVRLVTLTGPGGVGKTRLALEAARRLSNMLRGRAFWVPLAACSDPALVSSAIAATLGIKEAAGSTITATLKESLRAEKALIVLDNFEQVMAAAPLVADLLATAPALSILVTSRETLRVSGEHEMAVPPMEIPDLAALPAAETLRRCGAVALFVARARAARPGYELTDNDAPVVAEICSRLDGLPLAIELAAARVRVLSPRTLLARLASRLALLTGGARDLPARQQTMRNAIAWGHNLLSGPEKTLFARLSIFAGGFTLEAAETLAGDAEVPDVLEGLTSLADKSLLRALPEQAGESRFQMLETLREFGLECLVASGEADRLRASHARFYLQRTQEAEPGLVGDQQAAWLARLEADRENIRTALSFLLAPGKGNDGEDLGVRMAGALWWSWYLHGHYGEGRRYLDTALSKVSASSASRAKVLLGAGALAFLQCDYGRAEALLHESVALSKELGDGKGLAESLQFLGSVAREQGSYAQALTFHESSLAIWRELHDERGIARSLNYVGFASWLQGDFSRAHAVCRETLATFRRLSDHEGMAWSLLNLGAAAYHGGDMARAATLCEESLQLSRRVGYKEGTAWSHDILGNVALASGRPEEAREHLGRSFQLHKELGDLWRMASVLESLARTALSLGKATWAARLFGAADGLREGVKTPLPPAERGAYEAGLASVRAALSEQDLSRLRGEGSAGSPERALDPEG